MGGEGWDTEKDKRIISHVQLSVGDVQHCGEFLARVGVGAGRRCSVLLGLRADAVVKDSEVCPQEVGPAPEKFERKTLRRQQI